MRKNGRTAAGAQRWKCVPCAITYSFTRQDLTEQAKLTRHLLRHGDHHRLADPFASNIAAAVLFSYFGIVDFAHAIPMGLAMIVGAWCGAHVALSKGAGYVRPLFIIMTTVLIGKQLFEFFK